MELILILTVITVGGFSLFTYIFKKLRFKKILTLLQQQQYDEFDKIVDSWSSRYLFPHFNIEYLKLNSYILRGDESKIDKSFDTLFTIKMTMPQKQDVYMKAFNYYVGLENKHKTKELIEVIEGFDNEEMKKEARTIYDVFILKRSNYIEEMEANLKDQDDAEKGITEYLLSVQYENKGNRKKAEEYLELSKSHLRDPEETTAE
ncbi:hypothetical protein M2475_002260 [Breznakia sp. PF5-3]|uniref:hypothetical protein n=1 Tax=unclassified Breznakia TaxID=2623764 RepID=UPI002404F8E7|nr:MULTISPECIES: hypothetical protein [unclassified Breznakia]MDF9825879.1 hypothetical protein [Breznakia sp. PM6-1]MDF9836675.1 hypothetical protein [Breznakia sp. PF5-3]MDF9838748.1 hypothetical protein [Breznakia sp. PFB2-8]MDF9860764.1 hypothetical protein [Breznakia sp. PH5-24]